jgi:hypothetical protein
MLVPMGAGLDTLFGTGRGGGGNVPSAATGDLPYAETVNTLKALKAMQGYR